MRKVTQKIMLKKTLQKGLIYLALLEFDVIFDSEDIKNENSGIK